MAERNRTLCWDCANACGDCTWSDRNEQKPVAGWTAVRREQHHKDGTTVESYIVVKCPEFIRDSTDGGQHRIRRIEYAQCV